MSARLDATTLRRAMVLCARSLEDHRAELDSLNVFPVPDGDTGTNMLLTQQAVARATQDDSGDQLPELCERISRASLLGARGNSGVILAQVLRGACETLADPSAAIGGAERMAAALARAADLAYAAVARPREGTVLTVLRDASEAGRETAERDGATDADVVDAALAAARASVARTTDMMPELRAAGVVDAGGLGIVLLLDALRAALRDEPLSQPIGPAGPVGHAAATAGSMDGAFEVQFLLGSAHEVDVHALLHDLRAAGDSLGLVGGDGLYRVHIHTDEPGRVIGSARQAGTPHDVRVTSLIDQVARCVAGEAREVQVRERACGMVALADGDGLVRAFGSFGAAVVRGGADGSLPVAELVAAVDAIPAASVVIVSNRPDPGFAAEATTLASKPAQVVLAGSVIGGLAAATAFDPSIDLEENVRSMAAVAAGVRSEVITTVGDDAARTVVEVVRALLGGGTDDAEEPEVLTLVSGATAPDDEPVAVARALRQAFPELSVQALTGGQPGSRYLVGVG